MPKELSVTFKYGSEEEKKLGTVTEEDDEEEKEKAEEGEGQEEGVGEWKGWNVDEPELQRCGPAGSSRMVLVKGYSAVDVQRNQPMTVTIMFNCPMRGLKKA